MKKGEKKQATPMIKTYLFTALMLLMEQKDYEDITITDIAKKAGVSRMTYYRTYSSKEDILIQYFNDTAEKLFERFRTHPGITSQELGVLFFTFFQEHPGLVPLLRKANLLELVLNTFVQNLEHFYAEVLGRENLDTVADYRIHFHAGGIAFALIRWIDRGCPEAPEEMATLIESFVAPL